MTFVMDFIKRLFTGRRTATHTSATLSPSIASLSRPLRRAEFPAFQTYLESRFADTAVLSFQQIEDLLGSALPPMARTQASWWTDLVGDVLRYAPAWQAAGRTAVLNPGARNVAFARVAEARPA